MRQHVSKIALSWAAIALLAGASSGAVTTFSGTMSGAAENPTNASPATGNALVALDDVTHLLTVDVSFSGLTGGNATAAHIHCCAAAPTNVGVAVPLVGFPLATSGTYHQVFDLTQTTTYLGSFVTAHGNTAAGAEAALTAGLVSLQAYANIHDPTFPAGEIRTQLAPQAAFDAAIPALSASGQALLALLLGITAVVALRRRS